MLPDSDAVFQFSSCIPDDLRKSLSDSVTKAFKRLSGTNVESFFSAPYIAIECLEKSERGLFWHSLAPPSGRKGTAPVLAPGQMSPAQAFQNEITGALTGVSILPEGLRGGVAVFAILFKRNFIQGVANSIWQDYWASNPSHRLGGDGNADPNGPVHVDAFSLGFDSPNTLTLAVFGRVDALGTSANFTVSHSEKISIANRPVSIVSDRTDLITLTATTPSISLEPGAEALLNFLQSASFATTLGFPFGGLQAQESFESNFPSFSSLPTQPTLLGPLVVLLPVKHYNAGNDAIPHGNKTVFDYQIARIDDQGIFVAGTVFFESRHPSVVINGPQAILLDELPSNGLATFQCGVVTDDMRRDAQGNFKSVKWNVSYGVVKPADPQEAVNPETVTITRDLRGKIKAPDENVSVTVVDADDNSVSQSLTIPVQAGDTPRRPIGKVLDVKGTGSVGSS
jgi:hypothetical protein